MIKKGKTKKVKSFISMLLIENKSVKMFRGALIEASRRFIPNTLGYAVNEFHVQLHMYYEDLLVYQFQLNSDIMPFRLELSSVQVCYSGKTLYYNIKKGGLSTLKGLDGIPMDDLQSVVYEYSPVPAINGLRQKAAGCINSGVFEKSREITIGTEYNKTITGTFTPEWTDKLKITGTGFNTGGTTNGVH